MPWSIKGSMSSRGISSSSSGSINAGMAFCNRTGYAIEGAVRQSSQAQSTFVKDVDLPDVGRGLDNSIVTAETWWVRRNEGESRASWIVGSERESGEWRVVSSVLAWNKAKEGIGACLCFYTKKRHGGRSTFETTFHCCEDAVDATYLRTVVDLGICVCVTSFLWKLTHPRIFLMCHHW